MSWKILLFNNSKTADATEMESSTSWKTYLRDITLFSSDFSEINAMWMEKESWNQIKLVLRVLLMFDGLSSRKSSFGRVSSFVEKLDVFLSFFPLVYGKKGLC